METSVYSSEDDESYELACESLADLWKDEHQSHIMPCLSVRSAFDLFLTVMKWDEGSELIMTAINIPGMYRIAAHHKLNIKFLDVENADNMQPDIKHLQSIITNKTKCLLVAHVYGRMCNMKDLYELCKWRNILLVEDCAEAYTSRIADFGSMDCDLKLFSFGTIKTSTVFGGAVCKIKQREIYEMMREHEKKFHPVQTKSEYARKLLKYTFLTPIFNGKIFFRMGTSLFRMLNLDHKEVFVPMLRGFPDASKFFTNIRKRASVSLVNNMNIRFCSETGAPTSGSGSLNETYRKGAHASSKLMKVEDVKVVGCESDVINFWLFPLLVTGTIQPERFVSRMNEHGVDASRDSTQLKYLPSLHAAAGCHGDVNGDVIDEQILNSCPNARLIMERVVYLPIHRLVSYEDIDKVVAAVEQTVQELKNGNGDKMKLI